MRQPTVTDEGEVAACPKCDSTCVRASGRGFPSKTDTDRFRCDGCGASFDDPTFRESYATNRNNLQGLAKKLDEADPDDFPA